MPPAKCKLRLFGKYICEELAVLLTLFLLQSTRMLLAFYIQIWFAVLLAFCRARAEANFKTLVSSHDQNNTLANPNFGDKQLCSWNCTMIESDLTEEMKITFAKKKIIRLVVKYEKKVDDKCVNQMSRNSSGNFTEHWLVWLANRKRSTFTKTLEGLANLINNNEQHQEMRAVCVLQVVRTTATTPEYNGGIQFPLFAPGQLSELESEFNNTFCNTEGSNNLQPCLNISTTAGNTTTHSKGPFERGGWPVAIFDCLCLVLLYSYGYYSPAFLCLFSPTEVIADGVPEIVLEGASPVSFRSLIGNYFFSKDDTIWHRARTFVLRAVVLPLHFLGPAVFLYYLQRKNFFSTFSVFGVSHLYQQRFMIFSYCCYFILAFYISFFHPRPIKAKRPCFVCKFVKPKMLSCQDKLPRLIINHLRIQPLLLVECWRMFIRCFLNYCKTSLLVLPSPSKVSAIFFLRLTVFIIFWSSIPVVIVILLITTLLVALFAILLISPIATLCGFATLLNISHYRYLQLFSLLVCIVFTIPAIPGALILVVKAGVGVLLAIILFVELLLSEKILPFIACFVLVLYYMWSSYRSFTNKYQDLAFLLFKHYKNPRPDLCERMRLNKHQVQGNTSNTVTNEHNVIKIPKELFRIACEELMPIREGVCIMILKVTTIVSFVVLVFILTMLLNVGATPVMKALLTFLTGLFPKILAIYIDGGRQKKIEAMITDEKIPEIVQEYISFTIETYGFNQGQNHRSVDDDEVLLLDVDKENIELINMKCPTAT